VTILVALMSLVYPVWWKRNIYLSMITCCSLNLLGGLATAVLILGTQVR
jgi:hypothetical protein